MEDTETVPEGVETGEPSFLKDLAAAVMIVAGFVAAIPLPVVRLPGYLLMVAFDAIQRAIPPLSGTYGVALVGYLLVLALAAALLSPPLRARVDMTPWWYAPVAMSLVVVGLVVLADAVVLFLPTGAQPVSLTVTALVAVVLFAIAWVTIRGGKKRHAAVRDIEQRMTREAGVAAGEPGDEPTDDGDGSADESSDAEDDRR